MAGYRPKSLDELNTIFDKTMAAEKAIKKGTSLLEKGEDSFTSFSEEVTNEIAAEPEAEKPSDEISDSVSEFIAKLTTETEPVRAKPKMTVISAEMPKKEFEIAAEVFSDEAEASVKDAEKPSRDELFDEYMKIMSDDDDESAYEKKLSRKEKKKLKKKEKSESRPAEQQTEEIPEQQEEPSVTAQEPEFSAEESAEETVQYEVSSDEIDDFEFPENYTPEWIKEEEEIEEGKEDTAEKKASKGVKTAVKAVLALLLVALIGLSALSTVLKTVVAVNTGKLVSDKYYVFTTYKDYTELGLSEGTLVVTEKRYAEDGEVFSYVDYGSKSFEFGKRTDAITNDEGEMLYVTEKESGRTLVSRDDCKGVLYRTYEGKGGLVSFLTDNYIVIVAASAVAALVVVLLFVLVLRTKKQEEEDGEQLQQELSEETEDEFEDIFSTIE